MDIGIGGGENLAPYYPTRKKIPFTAYLHPWEGEGFPLPTKPPFKGEPFGRKPFPKTPLTPRGETPKRVLNRLRIYFAKIGRPNSMERGGAPTKKGPPPQRGDVVFFVRGGETTILFFTGGGRSFF